MSPTVGLGLGLGLGLSSVKKNSARHAPTGRRANVRRSFPSVLLKLNYALYRRGSARFQIYSESFG